ncbi:hypothetical protein PsAD46_04477 [Pseudovibrio sp. Ad46]|uniref:DUF6362 family protein n=1 Tax=unclassified Pseudovibrio TaxID=2627060 RepID=UPI0007AE4C94|nr:MULTISPECIES: DUF6362 family protein [unclassified Pseudovibrio]KZK78860.1 hypothetical protein PsAD46_04477 [Pseudovibrio sp. Ad46]KZK93664.1 hypothetical protein PsAD5_02981 [Pseudovibrio sp. Ad5]
MALTTTQIVDRLELAASTLRRLPNPPRSTPRRDGNTWPQVIHDVHEAYGYNKTQIRAVPSAKDIQHMEEAIDWLRYIFEPDDRKILWMRAEGFRWRPICIQVGLTRSTAHRRAVAAVLTIQRAINKRR